MSSIQALNHQKATSATLLQKADYLKTMVASETLLNNLSEDDLLPFETFEKRIPSILVDENEIFSPLLTPSLETLASLGEIATHKVQTTFGEKLYDDIEGFLDKEGLFIISPSPIITKAELKPSIGFKRMSSLGTIPEVAWGMNSSAVADCEFADLAVPSFLAKRNLSLEPILPSRSLFCESGIHLGKLKSMDDSINSRFKEIN